MTDRIADDFDRGFNAITNPRKALEFPTHLVRYSHIFPPIPIREYDVMAYLDGYEEDGIKGWGETEAIALKDLKTQWDENHQP